MTNFFKPEQFNCEYNIKFEQDREDFLVQLIANDELAPDAQTHYLIKDTLIKDNELWHGINENEVKEKVKAKYLEIKRKKEDKFKSEE